MELKSARGRLFFCLLLILLLPMLQSTFNFIESGKLNGAWTPHSNVQFTWPTWFNSSYQEKKAAFINDSIGFRPDLVRVNNQVNFWLFKTLSSDIYMGKDGYLFMKDYIDEYNGRHYKPIYDIGIRASLTKLKLVQDTLDRMGKTFIFAYAPGKAYFMPENIPLAVQRPDGPHTSNYSTFKRLGDSLKLRQLDFNALFMAMKDTSKDLLFARHGIHWSLYGSLLASDTLIKFIERERNIKMPHLVITKLCHPGTIIFPDNDLAKLSNVIFPMKESKLCYPEYHYDSDSTKTKPKIIFIGDSFGGQWIANEFPQNVSTGWEFWFYFNWVWEQQHPHDAANEISKGYDWQRSMSNADCIVSIWNPVNLQAQTSPNAFIEKMYTYFYPDKK
jgi:hypothetical protein